MATIASNSGKKNKHKTNDHDSNSNQKNAHNQYQQDNDSSKIRQVTEIISQVRLTGPQWHKCNL